MPENAGAINVSFTADTKGLKKGTEEAKGSIKSLVSEAKAMSGLIQGAIAGAVVAFGNMCVKEFAKSERAINSMTASVKMNGESIVGLKEQLESYVDTLEYSTRFQDTELTDSLTNLNTLTRNLSDSVGLNQMAMNLAVARNMSLAQASDIVGQAFLGNQRGVMMLAKELGVVGQNAEDTGFLFAELERRTRGMAEAEEGAARVQEQVNVTWSNFYKVVGEQLAPVLDALLLVSRGIVAALGVVVKIVDTVIAGLVYVASFIASSITDFTNLEQAQRKSMDAMSQGAKEMFADIWSGEDKTTAKIKQTSAEQISIKAATNKKIIKDNEEMQKILLAENQRYQDALKQEAKDRNDYEYWIMTEVKGEEMQALVRQQQMSKETYQKMRADAEAYATAVSTYTKEAVAIMIEEYNKGTLSVGRAFEIMGKQIAKALIKAVGDALMQMAAKDFVLAMAAFARKEYSAAAEFAIAGGIESAGAGSIYAVADSIKLAKGGIVQPNDGSQKFEIGEAGRPELVMPLDTAAERGLLGGGGQAKISMTINGVTDAASFESSYSSIERRLMATWENMNRRRGLRTA